MQCSGIDRIGTEESGVEGGGGKDKTAGQSGKKKYSLDVVKYLLEFTSRCLILCTLVTYFLNTFFKIKLNLYSHQHPKSARNPPHPLIP